MFECWFWDVYVILLFVCVYKFLFVRFIDIKTTRNIFSKDQKSHKIWRALFVGWFDCCLFWWVFVFLNCNCERTCSILLSFHWKDEKTMVCTPFDWTENTHALNHRSRVSSIISDFPISSHAHARTRIRTRKHANANVHTFHYLRFVFIFEFFQSISTAV